MNVLTRKENRYHSFFATRKYVDDFSHLLIFCASGYFIHSSSSGFSMNSTFSREQLVGSVGLFWWARLNQHIQPEARVQVQRRMWNWRPRATTVWPAKDTSSDPRHRRVSSSFLNFIFVSWFLIWENAESILLILAGMQRESYTVRPRVEVLISS